MRRYLRRHLALLVAVTFSLVFPLGGGPQAVMAQAGSLVAPKDTIFLIEFLETVDSGANKEGDKVRFETRDDVVVSGVNVIPYGTRGLATVKKIKKAGLFGRGGSIDIDFGSLRSANNVEIPLEIGKSAAGKNEDAGIIVPVAALIVFLPLVLFGFMQGQQARIPSGTQIYVNTQADVNLNATSAQMKKSAPPQPKPVRIDLSETHLCQEIDSSGNPAKMRDWFDEDSKAIFVWASFKQVSKEASVLVKWYYQENPIYAKKVSIAPGGTKFNSMILPANGKQFKTGNYKMELVSGAQILKTIPFSVKKEE